MKALAFGLALLAIPTSFAARDTYEGYKVVRVSVNDANKDAVTSTIKDLGLDTWISPSKGLGYADVVVPPSSASRFRFKTKGFKTSMMHANLSQSIHENYQYNEYKAGAVDESWFNSYHSYTDHISFIKDLSATYSNMSRIIYAGNSLEGRPITGLSISSPGTTPNTKPSIVFFGTVHAREWITTMVVEYIAYQLLGEYSRDATVQSILNKYEFLIFPVVNPDGFTYTQTSSRMWRKNRRAPPSGSSCAGVDINRNYNFQWSTPGGSSTNPCADDYRGSSAGSEPEAQGLMNLLNGRKNTGGLKLFVDYHSYSQILLYPWGYTCSGEVSNNAQHASLASQFVSALRALYGTSYKSGPTCKVLYQVSGSSLDYAKVVSAAEYSFSPELRDTGSYGFVLPSSQILPSGKETYAGIKALLKTMG